MARKKESKQKDQKPKVNKELEGMEIKIDSFGEIRNSLSIDKINEFLNKSKENDEEE